MLNMDILIDIRQNEYLNMSSIGGIKSITVDYDLQK